MEFRQNKTSWFQRWFGRRIFLIINLIFLGFLVFSFGREFARNWEIQKEIKSLEAEAEDLQSQHLEIEKLVTAAGTEAFVEKEARLKLGLSKSGENVVIIEEEQVNNSGNSYNNDANNQVLNSSVIIDSSPTSIANPKKWWYYFFDINKFFALKSYGK